MYSTVSILQESKPGLRNPYKYFQTIHRVGKFRQKIIPRKMDSRNELFVRRNSACSAEKKTLRIVPNYSIVAKHRVVSFRQKIIPRKMDNRNKLFVRWKYACLAEKKTLRVVPNYSTEEKTTRNSVPWNKNRNKFLEFCSEAFYRRKHALNSVWGTENLSFESLPQNAATENFQN